MCRVFMNVVVCPQCGVAETPEAGPSGSMETVVEDDPAASTETTPPAQPAKKKRKKSAANKDTPGDEQDDAYCQVLLETVSNKFILILLNMTDRYMLCFFVYL